MQSPACGATVGDAIAQALRIADVRAENERRLDSEISEDCRLWRELLRLSQGQLFQDMAPTISRKALEASANVELTQRRWMRFLRWFERNMAEPLHRACMQSGVPALYGGRLSDRRGGRAEYSEAQYFVSFQSPDALAGAADTVMSAQSACISPDGSARNFNAAPGRRHDRPSGRIPGPLSEVEARLQAQVRDLEDVTFRLKRLLAERDLEIDVLKGRLPPS